MRRVRFGKFKNIEVALDIELRQIILKGYRKNKLIKYFSINEIRKYHFHLRLLIALGLPKL